MNSDPASARYYVVRNGQATGPYSAADMMAQFQAGAIAADSLVCEEGGSAWVPMRDLAPVLRSALPPAAPSGYAAPAPPRPAPVQQVVIVSNGGDNTKPLRIGTLLAALILFFVPWLEFKCAGNRLMYQSGVGAILNRVSPDDNMEQMAQMGKGPKKNFTSEDMGKDGSYSILAGVALLAAVIGFGAALGQSRQLSGVFAAVALGCLGAQAIVGFPFKTAVTKLIDETKGKSMARANGAGGNDPGEEMAKAMMGGNMVMSVDYSPWFYAELGLLGLAALMGLSGGKPQRTR